MNNRFVENAVLTNGEARSLLAMITNTEASTITEWLVLTKNKENDEEIAIRIAHNVDDEQAPALIAEGLMVL